MAIFESIKIAKDPTEEGKCILRAKFLKASLNSFCTLDEMRKEIIKKIIEDLGQDIQIIENRIKKEILRTTKRSL